MVDDDRGLCTTLDMLFGLVQKLFELVLGAVESLALRIFECVLCGVVEMASERIRQCANSVVRGFLNWGEFRRPHSSSDRVHALLDVVLEAHRRCVLDAAAGTGRCLRTRVCESRLLSLCSLLDGDLSLGVDVEDRMDLFLFDGLPVVLLDLRAHERMSLAAEVAKNLLHTNCTLILLFYQRQRVRHVCCHLHGRVSVVVGHLVNDEVRAARAFLLHLQHFAL